MIKNLVKIKGRDSGPGRPLLYKTSDVFLEYFGINRLSDMPKFKEISEAYEILTNQDKRRMYDNFGYDAISGDLPPINPIDLFQSLFKMFNK